MGAAWSQHGRSMGAAWAQRGRTWVQQAARGRRGPSMRAQSATAAVAATGPRLLRGKPGFYGAFFSRQPSRNRSARGLKRQLLPQNKREGTPG